MNKESLLFLPTPKEHYGFELIDFSDSSDELFETMVILNQATVDWINQKISTADYTDLLAYFDINPENHLADSELYFKKLCH